MRLVCLESVYFPRSVVSCTVVLYFDNPDVDGSVRCFGPVWLIVKLLERFVVV